MALKTLRNFQVVGALYATPGGAEIAAGDEVRLFLNQVANPDFPEYIDGVAVNPIARVNVISGGCVSEGTSYSFQYESDDLEDAATQLNVCDVVNVSAIACCEVLRDALDAEIAARTAADVVLQGNIDEVQDDLDTWDVITLSAEPVQGVVGVPQVETQTAVGTILTAGTLVLTVTAAGMTGSPLALTFDVDAGDTPSVIAAKAAAKLEATAAVTALFNVDQIAADFALTANTNRANDGTLVIAIANGTATGLTDDAASSSTTAGVAAVAGTVAERIGQHARWGERLWEATDTTPASWVEITTERNSVMQSYVLTGLTGGGGGTRLDSLVVTTEDIGRVQMLALADNGPHYVFVLEAGTDAESSPNIIRPDNYAGGTNEIVWKWKPAMTNSASIVDATTGGNGSGDDGLVALYGDNGQLQVSDNLLFLHSLGVTSLTAADNSASRTVAVPDADGSLSLSPAIVAATPLTGFTITAARYTDQTHYLTPAGTLATGTFTLPTAANSRVGQIVRLLSTQIVTALTVNVSGGGSIVGAALTAAAANTSYAWQCVSVAGAGTWIRLQ